MSSYQEQTIMRMPPGEKRRSDARQRRLEDEAFSRVQLRGSQAHHPNNNYTEVISTLFCGCAPDPIGDACGSSEIRHRPPVELSADLGRYFADLTGPSIIDSRLEQSHPWISALSENGGLEEEEEEEEEQEEQEFVASAQSDLDESEEDDEYESSGSDEDRFADLPALVRKALSRQSNETPAERVAQSSVASRISSLTTMTSTNSTTSTRPATPPRRRRATTTTTPSAWSEQPLVVQISHPPVASARRVATTHARLVTNHETGASSSGSSALGRKPPRVPPPAKITAHAALAKFKSKETATSLKMQI